MTKLKTTTVDVLVVGGGMAGCALAYALAQEYRVLVLEKQPETSYQDRVGESLPAAALRSLRTLGLGDALDQSSHSNYHGVVSIWGQSTPIRKDFFDSLDGTGLHVDRGSLNRAIKSAATKAGVRFIHNAQLTSLSGNTGKWVIEAKSGDQRYNINAHFVVDASGRANIVARKLGLKRINIDRAVAIHTQCSRIETDRATQKQNYIGTTLIEAVDNGWWYRAPLPNGKSILSFHSDSDLPSTRIMQQPTHWLEALRSTKLIASDIELPKESDLNLTLCAANSSFSTHGAGHAWLAIGDAALAFDPLSSQGMFNALTTALLAKQCIYQTLEGNGNATSAYAQSLSKVCNAYQRNLSEVYQSETRWPESPFWKRRCA